ncbi:PP2C family serine/threonine-protein phosphatase [Fibrobacter sp.]|uniref:PP2C family serine/threonine-protein phosphatase n=1 Tax=Fibrobacter sp. TaxID=35828 RepID=UPI00388F0BD5
MWCTLECAVQGKGHLKTGIPCQDKTYSIVKGSCTVCALADGAGSAYLSHFGAETVTKTICDYMADNFDAIINEDGVSVKQNILAIVGDSLNNLCQEKGCTVKDLASTLLFVAEKAGTFVICHIGDGVIGYVKNDKVHVASHPENGEFANTTVFTTSSDAIASMKIIKGNLNQISGFILMSDGTEASFYNKRDKVLSPSLTRLVKLASTCDAGYMSRMLHNTFENLVKQKTSDDCSIVLMSHYADGAGYKNLSEKDKCNILGLPNTRASRKRQQSFEIVLEVLQTWKTYSAIKGKLHWRGKKLYRVLKQLTKAKIVEVREDGHYKSVLRAF